MFTTLTHFYQLSTKAVPIGIAFVIYQLHFYYFFMGVGAFLLSCLVNSVFIAYSTPFSIRTSIVMPSAVTTLAVPFSKSPSSDIRY